MVQYGEVCYAMLWYVMVWYGMAWHGMVWHDIAWYGMLWNGMISYGVALLLGSIWRTTLEIVSYNISEMVLWYGILKTSAHLFLPQLLQTSPVFFLRNQTGSSVIGAALNSGLRTSFESNVLRKKNKINQVCGTF